LMILGVLAPSFVEPLYDAELNIMGIPAGLFLIGCAFIWMAIGVAAMAFWSSRRRRSLALFLFAGAATTIVLLAPALLVILKNLGT
jgi:hypothetical protein